MEKLLKTEKKQQIIGKKSCQIKDEQRKRKMLLKATHIQVIVFLR